MYKSWFILWSVSLLSGVDHTKFPHFFPFTDFVASPSCITKWLKYPLCPLSVFPDGRAADIVFVKYRLCPLSVFPDGRAADVVFVTLFWIAVGTAVAWYGSSCAMPGGHCLNILLFWRRSTAAWLVFRVGTCLEVSLFFPPSHLSPSLTSLLTSVDVNNIQSFFLSLVLN